MKTSNKILLGTVAFIILLFSAIHVALYAKYKKGEFITVAQLHEERYDKHVLNGINKVEVSGLENLEIYPSDTFRIELEKQDSKKPELSFEQKGDVLVLKGGTMQKNSEGKEELNRSFAGAVIYLPAGVSINITRCEVRFRGAADTTKAYSGNIIANYAGLTFSAEKRENKAAGYFNNISITATGGRIEFSDKTAFKELGLSLTTAEITDLGFTADKITVNADDKSDITLKGTNLKKVINKQ
jgi:hypothetical protein